MNFGNKSGASPLVKQQATYHLAPNFTTRPFPNGPFDLGTVVKDLQHFTPLNQGSNRISVAEDEQYSHNMKDISASVRHAKGPELSLLAGLLDRSIGGSASLKGQRDDEDVYEIANLQTIHFSPRPAYLQDVMKLSDVADYLDDQNYRSPVYLITALKIAWGARISMKREYMNAGDASVGATIVSGVVDAGVAVAAESN
ncbi:hypothetical protein QQX98_005105 [Neonectria punicea]|uniref:Catalase n=1 Tax=Neonectria punicea TaxID=979145 RepID=A0ABR1H682_9HYPO